MLLLVPATAGAQRPLDLREVIVAPDSDAMRALRAQPVPADFFDLLVARESFRLTGDRRPAQVLDLYLARAGLMAIAGQPLIPAAQLTLGPLVDDPDAMFKPPPGLAEKVMRSALYPRPVGPAELGEKDGQYRVVVDIENIGDRPITGFDAALRIDVEGGERIFLACRPSSSFERLAPGEAARHACTAGSQRLPFPALAKAVDAAQLLPERWRLMPSRITYLDPPVNFGHAGVLYWLDSPRAARQAAEQLKAAGCRARASCLADLRRTLGSDPRVLYAAGGLLLALSVGWLALRLRRR